jgi:uncharacterized protein (DUF3820 family)
MVEPSKQRRRMKTNAEHKMSRTIFREKVLEQREIPMEGDATWWAERKAKSKPDLTDERLGLHNKYGCHCGGYLRIIYTIILSGGQERHYGYCGECAKELCASLKHEQTKELVENFTLYFGKHKGSKIKDVPKDYLKWCTENLTDEKMKTKIKLYLEIQSSSP